MGEVGMYQSRTQITLNKPGQFNQLDQANFLSSKAKKPGSPSSAAKPAAPKDDRQVSSTASSAAQAAKENQEANSVADKARAAQIAKDQAVLLQNISQRMADLGSELSKLSNDLKDPARAPEARARMNLVQMQMAELGGISRQVQGISVPAGADAKTAAAMSGALARIDGDVKGLSDPSQRNQAKADVLQQLNVLQNPALAGQSNAALNHQKAVSLNLFNRISELAGEMNNLVGDLGDPRKAAEADARLKQLNMQVSQVIDVQNHVGAFRVTPGMSPADQAKAANLLAGINDQVANLSDPNQMPSAQSKLQDYYRQLSGLSK